MVVLLLSSSYHLLCSQFYMVQGTLARTLVTASIREATTAAAQGVPVHLIKTLGHWSSDTYQIYIRTPVSCIVRVSSQLVA